MGTATAPSTRIQDRMPLEMMAHILILATHLILGITNYPRLELCDRSSSTTSQDTRRHILQDSHTLVAIEAYETYSDQAISESAPNTLSPESTEGVQASSYIRQSSPEETSSQA